MIIVSDLIRIMDLYAKATDLSVHSVGRYAGGSGDFYSRLAAGHDITTRRASRVSQWLSDHWPDDVEWPPEIARPAPKDRAA